MLNCALWSVIGSVLTVIGDSKQIGSFLKTLLAALKPGLNLTQYLTPTARAQNCF